MSKTRRRPINWLLPLLVIAVFAFSAIGQTSNATIRGKILDNEGDPIAGAEVNAVSLRSGFVHTVVSRQDGSYGLLGLVPGEYQIVIASPAHQTRQRELTVLVGQSLNIDFQLAPSTVMAEAITVVGDQVAVEMETHEVTTNVTETQMEQLPQNSRNFMNFAALAPGVTISDSDTRKTFQSGAQSAEAVNVFIDGISYKNDILAGGIVGQDASRGNPFPQTAVQEFRVLTQNYSAEFQKASSAVITAVTKSGSNTLSGEVFGYWQDGDLVADNPITGTDEEFDRLQTGLSLGGPIVRDSLHYFLSYEANDQERTQEVRLGASGPPELRQQLSQYEGFFPSDFDSDLFFGKLSYQPSGSQILDFSAFIRTEEDFRSFGNEVAFTHRENVMNDVENYALRHNYTTDSWFNEASLGYQEYVWNPTPVRLDLPKQIFSGILTIGGRDTEQDKSQQRLSLRDDLTFSPIDFGGPHVFKVGVTFDRTEYDLNNFLVGNPIFHYRSQENWERPWRVEYGFGDPQTGADNDVYGIYLQDDWNPTDQLLVNVGIRYDYESDMFPTDWVTPANIRNDLAEFVDEDRYFTDGNDRQAIDDMYAPRLGITYDVLGNNRTIVFGGWGKYYDRTLRGQTDAEKFRQTWNRGELLFSDDGQPLPDGRQTVAWDPSLLDKNTLFNFIQQGNLFRPEVFLIENDTEPPYADQWTVGVRQQLGDYVGSLSYANTQSYNGFTYGWGHRNPDGTCCRWGEVQALGYQALITSQDDKRTWYEAIYLTINKAFTSDSMWGGGLSYTHALTAEGIGGDLFSFDFPSVTDYPRRPLNNIQDDLLIANAVVGLPYNLTAGGVLTYGSGRRYDIVDRTLGTGPDERILRGEGEGSDYVTLDLRLQYDIMIGGISLGIVGEAFNVTDDEVESSWYNVLDPNDPARMEVYGTPRQIVDNSQRRYQYGLRIRY